jgi:hypothetical protein
MDTRVTACPFCNATVPLPATLPATQKVPCPRCGESVPVRPSTLNGAPAGQSVTVSPPVGNQPLPATKAWSNRKIAATVLGVMALMATISLVYALRTTEFRRSNDHPAGPHVPPLPAVTATPPTELTGLEYLPANCTAVVGLHVAQALQSEAGRTLLNRSGLAQDGSFLGLKLDTIDHAVLGANLDRVPPQVTLVVRTRQPYSGDEVRKALQAGREVERGGRTVYRFKLSQGGLELGLVCPDERTLLVGLVDDFETVPTQPAKGAERLPAPLRDLMTTRLPGGSVAWAVAHAADHPPAVASLLSGFTAKPSPDIELLGQVRSLALSLRPTDGVTLNAAVQGRDATATAKLGDLLRKWGEAAEVPVNPAIQGDWVTVTASATPEKWAAVLGRPPAGPRP